MRARQKAFRSPAVVNGPSHTAENPAFRLCPGGGNLFSGRRGRKYRMTGRAGEKQRRGVRAVSAVCVPSPQQAGLFHHRFGPRRYGPYQPAHRRFIRYALHLLFRHEGSAPHRYPCRARPSASCSRNRKSGKPLVMQKPGGGSFRAFAYLMFI